MKTNYIKTTLSWIALTSAILLFSFSIVFSQSKETGTATVHIEKNVNGHQELFDTGYTGGDGDPSTIIIEHQFDHPIPLPNPVPFPDTIPPFIPIDTFIVNKRDAKGFNKEDFGDLEKQMETLHPDNLVIYPNPAQGIFSLTFHLDTKGDLKIALLDIEGREIYSQQFENFNGDYTNSFNLSNKGKGIYILTMEQNNQRLTKKIVVN